MKKLLVLLVAVAAMWGCTTEKEYVTVTEMNRMIYDFTVTNDPYPDGWGYSNGLAPHFFYNFNFPELDQFLYDNGTMVVYYDDGNTQYPLPYVRTFEEPIGGGQVRRYTRTIDYEFRRGGISFYVTNDDFQYPVKPGETKFRVVIIW